MRWCIEGCIKWQTDGLQVPQVVTNASQEYLNSQDAFGDWPDERCNCDKGNTLTEESLRLWESWKAWAMQRGDRSIMSYKALIGILKGRGFSHGRHPKTRRGMFYGLSLRG